MHTHKEKVWASPLVRRSTVKRKISHWHRSVLLGRLPSDQLSGFFFHTWPTLGPSPGVCMYPSAKMDLEVKASGRSKTHYGLELFSDFWLQGAFLCMCIVSLILYSERFFFFASLCPWHDYSLEIFRRNKDWLFTLFLLLLPFWIANGAGCKFFNWSPPISYLRKCKEKLADCEFSVGGHLSSTSGSQEEMKCNN